MCSDRAISSTKTQQSNDEFTHNRNMSTVLTQNGNAHLSNISRPFSSETLGLFRDGGSGWWKVNLFDQIDRESTTLLNNANKNHKCVDVIYRRLFCAGNRATWRLEAIQNYYDHRPTWICYGISWIAYLWYTRKTGVKQMKK